jgi:hypothetical protein
VRALGDGNLASVLELVLTVGVLGFVGLRLVQAAGYRFSPAGRAATRPIVAGIGWRHIWPAPLVLGAVIIVASVLLLVPPLRWGWWTAIGGGGNPVTGTTDQTSGTPLEWIIPIVFLGLLLPAIPLFALAEERAFRQGAERWSAFRRAWKCVLFGLAHALIGIPIGVALALSCGGAYFMVVYLRRFRRTGSEEEAVLDSARAHAVYNTIIVGLVLITVIALAFAGEGAAVSIG